MPAPRRPELLDSLAALSDGAGGPLHLQLRAALDGAVDSAGLAHGTRIWSESQLMRRYGVSRHVVRQALNQLVLEGRLSVRKGAGYFVNRRRVVTHLPAGGGAPGGAPEPFAIELLDVGVAPAAAEEEVLAAAESSAEHRRPPVISLLMRSSFELRHGSRWTSAGSDTPARMRSSCLRPGPRPL